MARPIRLHVPGGFFHVTLRGNHRLDIFATPADRALLNTIVAAALADYGARLHAYCWMSNHIHMLIEVGDAPLGDLMRCIASGYARAYQRKLPTTGHLFERRYHATLVDTDTYLLEVVRYIHLNPVRARMVRTADAWHWSSHHAYRGVRGADRWVTTGTALGVFSRDRDKAIRAYRRFMDVNAGEVRSPFENVTSDQPFILGSPEFVARFASTSPRQRMRAALEALIAEGCAKFRVTPEALAAPRCNPQVGRLRAWLAREARARKIASLATVARRVGCDPKGLRKAMQKFPDGKA
jgi:REP element-mobilizing transposase RayT